MSHRQEVVVVDGLAETTQVLRAVLEPRGLNVTRRSSRQLSCDDPANPSRVLVLHDATDPDTDGPCVIIGRIVNPSDPAGVQPSGCAKQAKTYTPTFSTDGDTLSLKQPFHYADLFAAIDALVDRPAA